VLSEIKKWNTKYLRKLEDHTDALAVNLLDNSETTRMKIIAAFSLISSLTWTEFGSCLILKIAPYSLKSALLALCFILVSCLAYSSSLNMEATLSSETSADFKRTPR
jgi:hypothetical protein